MHESIDQSEGSQPAEISKSISRAIKLLKMSFIALQMTLMLP
ncbi:Unknown protein sequence [Pseudomonas savastanoi pv. glycinea]|uniref:Uncharacterized protein n=1 Tax=Pseudomonas savastanoi pv. glycinea TaxID=318 RepID=A0ABR5LCX5_PSESG|nr:hypothetical protein AC519_1437 [Pseudomonas savastanoi]KPB32464.1 Unknown protein sequence [Pseudomonas savastanoi pv. phaseolicola]KPB61484.1 Unknown protein sequence [Pseudomonas amygdali pv. mellea]KPC23394.1 Unknown protein sequence [Pseudomonas savastanoi pv. glycinea]KPC56737.1 Unknown protein sequence [Pseudomonas amygdali pv. morsprunorum]